MSKKSKAAKSAAKAGAAVASTKAVKTASEVKPFVERIASDEDLRDNVRVAFDNARQAYDRLAAGDAPRVLLEDKKFHRNLEDAAAALRQAGDSLTAKPKKRRLGVGRLLLLGTVGAIAAVALSEGLRNKLLDALFGAEEEFDYTSTTTPPPAPAVPPTPAPNAS
jgi:GNAT superfamily N-acetyltransferase